jgi:hypothetical protein
MVADHFNALRGEIGLNHYRDAFLGPWHPRGQSSQTQCALVIAPEQQFGRGYRVYIKRLRILLGDRGWSYGFDIDDEEHSSPGEDPIERSIRLYHREYRPHEAAYLIVNVPDEEHGSHWP